MSNVPGPPPLLGLVLIGGQSTRMGQDKSGLVYHQKKQREHLTDLLSPLCEQVYWSANQVQHTSLSASNLLVDSYPAAGPMGGLLTALDTYPEAAWLLVPCDLPDLDSATLHYLVANRNAATLVTAFWDADGIGAEPLVSLWEPGAGPLLRTWFGAGRRSLRQFIAHHPATLLNAPANWAFRNVNSSLAESLSARPKGQG